ncbi:MAG: hypothetical protein M3044_17655 [Thermoproteota archaeon]|nr:hypothetical protein [Thermoproteota archaeon]
MRSTQTITCTKGHGWAFNGESAWKTINERWKQAHKGLGVAPSATRA